MTALDPTARFSGRAADYALARPSYPREVLGILAQACGLGPTSRVADLGSGTGIFTALLLSTDASVRAVEPNADMRAEAEAALGKKTGFTSVDGRAEATTLDDASVDLVTAAQAFHWFDVALAHRELVRILVARENSSGNVALIWNDREVDGTPLLRDYEALLLAHCPKYRELQGKADAVDKFDALLGKGRWRRFTTPNEQLLDREGFVARLLSSSYAPPPDHLVYDALRALFDREVDPVTGTVSLLYRTVVIVGTPAPT